jgi:hypothetical protein
MDVYHAVLMRVDDGVAVPTCPVTLEERNDNGGYPTLSVARAGAPMRIAKLKGEAVVRLYGVSGILHSTEKVNEFNSEIKSPSVPGVYILSIESDGQTTNHKIVVK